MAKKNENGYESIKSGRIPVNKAIFYLKNLKQEKDKTGRPIGENFKRDFVKTFDAQVFKDWYNSGDFDGIMAWYCSKNKNGIPFLVFEKKSKGFTDYYLKKDTIINDLRPESNDLLHPLYSSSPNFLGDNYIYENYLRTQKTPKDIKHNISRKIDADRWIKTFMSFEKLNPNQKFPHGYLENGRDGEDYFGNFLFKQNFEVKYIRYFFGYDISERDYKLRFFLVPVDDQGRNIIDFPDTSKFYNEGNFLQFSWPPRPSNIID